MWIILFSIALAISFVYLNAVPYLRLKDFLKAQAESGRTFTRLNDAKIWVAIQVAMILFSIILGIIDRQNESTVAIAIALTGSFGGNIFAAQVNRCLYYNESGFIMSNKYIPYKSVKDFERKRGVLRIVDVTTYSGERGKMTPGCANMVRTQKEAREKRKEK